MLLFLAQRLADYFNGLVSCIQPLFGGLQAANWRQRNGRWTRRRRAQIVERSFLISRWMYGLADLIDRHETVVLDCLENCRKLIRNFNFGI